MKSLDLKWKT